MGTSNTRSIDVASLKARLHTGELIALIDVREPGEAGEGRPLLAVNVPYSLLELQAPTMLPSLTLPIVAMDDGGDDDRAERACARLAAVGYTNVAVMEGGFAAWADAGYSVYKGVNVPSKTFGELLEHEHDTPAIDAAELEAMRTGDDPPIILDGRTPAEYQRMSIPDGISCPNGELALRSAAMAKPGQTIVVNCAGRTRSIVGAQTLIDFGVPHKVVALRNGTMGWSLAGFELDHGETRKFPDALPDDVLAAAQDRASALASTDGIEFVSGPTVDAWRRDASECVYVLDVRTAEEFAAGHQPGAVHAPGGQLVQTTDHWIAARGARVVLVDDEGVRAVMAARWLQQMGHQVAVLTPGESLTELAQENNGVPDLAELGFDSLSDGAIVIDVRESAKFGDAHVSGAQWGIRPRLQQFAGCGEAVLVADDAGIAALAAMELEGLGVSVAGWCGGNADAWRAAGLDVVEDERVPDAERIDFLFFVHDRHSGNQDAAREYLAWEIGLVGQLDADERALFSVSAA